MTYNVFSGTLNLTQSINLGLGLGLGLCVLDSNTGKLTSTAGLFMKLLQF